MMSQGGLLSRIAPGLAGAASGFVAVAAGAEALSTAGVVAVTSVAALALQSWREDGQAEPSAPDNAPEPAPEAASHELDGLPIGVGRALLDRLPNPVVLLDGAGEIVFANSAASETFGRNLVALQFSIAFRTPDLLAAINSAYLEETPAEVDFQLVRPKALMLRAYVRPVPAPIMDAETAPLSAPAVLIVVEDHTKDRRADQLHRDFVANASHELKTPLASIGGFVETLMGHAKDDPEAQERFLPIMGKQVERMRRLVEDLISLNRIEMNEHVQPREPMSLSALASEAAAGVSTLGGDDGKSIEVDIPFKSPHVMGDRDQLGQVLTNLIDNALKYGRGERPVMVRLAEPSPDHPDMVGVVVEDDGEGIPREHIPRLTERFYRISVSRSREKGGTGLGLAIVKHIVNRHRGELEIQSEIGKGSTFTVWLPEAARKNVSDVAAA